MNDIKYEPVFGNQAFFDAAPEDAEYVAIDGNPNKFVFYKDIAAGESYWFLDSYSDEWRQNIGNPCNPINAMRRIIQEPKRWTVEDHKAISLK